MAKGISSWRRLGIAALVLIILAVCGHFAWQGWGYWRSRAAAQAVAQRDFAAARRLLDDCRRVWPNSGEVLLQAAQVARRADALDEVPPLLEAAERAGISSESIAFERELLRLQSGDARDAANFLRASADHPEVDETALILEALVIGGLRRVDLETVGRALDAWEKNRTSEPERVQGWIWRGELALRKGDVDEAANYYRQVVQSRPHDATWRLRLAELLTRNSPREALELLDQFSSAATSADELSLYRARCYRSLGELDEAERLLAQLLELDRHHFQAILEQGHVALDLRQFDLAERRYREAVGMKPEMREPNLALARCLQAAGKQAEAEKYRAKVAQIDALVEQRLKQLQDKGRIER